ncbi:PA1571 family protein [Phytopseudomonas dryadis]|uniref:Uncharacterized protein n=1 Tax=Phytopseudomonas dryadis TaxID=2487520 RepID=A0ABY1Z500_9GAMM|nr:MULTISPECIES: PA1571 family protein [Pseudomonas]TBV01494.1 hypothetical protein DNK34_20865 [Pseudomonas dryadis]TBV19433.1 hypothetical protein DNK41_02540 [Pseudomonas sp. FRB 230]
MSPSEHPSAQPATQAPKELLNGAVIDPDGREIPITEHMIQDACDKLDKDLGKPEQDPAS